MDQWVEQLTDLVTGHGFDTFVMWSDGGDPQRQMARFAEEVAPAVRDRVTAIRLR